MRRLVMTSFKRSLLAIILCFGLLASIVVHHAELREAKGEAIFFVSATMWKVSELIFESQSLVTAITQNDGSAEALARIRLQFEILWSRIDVVDDIDFKQRPATATVLEKYDTWRVRWDRELFDPVAVRDLDFSAMRNGLEPLITETRRAWLSEFSEARFSSLGQVATTTQTRIERQEWMIVGLLALIVAYLFAEIYIGNIAQRRERRLRDAADQANRIKSDFIANVSHEIRTPLNGIMSMASHLADQEMTPEQRECIKVIEGSGDLLLATINDVLDLSKIEAGEMTIDARDFDPVRCLTLARDLYRDQARGKGIALDLVLPDGPLPRLVGDERRFRQVLHNLVSNAVKFTDAGAVRIVARFSDGNGPDDRAGLHVSVEDTGPGIPDHALDRVFEPFGQASDSSDRRFGGTGLGLPISRSLCRAMGGDISLQSERGIGSRFDVVLPFPVADTTSADAKDDPPERPASALSGRIMIVDDNATNRFVLRTLLKAHPLVIFEADSGRDALEQLAVEPVDLVLMDVQMPGMNGLEATARLIEAAALAGARAPAVVAVTANVMPQQVAAYRAAGMLDVLPKPVSKPALLAVLERVLAEAGPHAGAECDPGASAAERLDPVPRKAAVPR